MWLASGSLIAVAISLLVSVYAAPSFHLAGRGLPYFEYDSSKVHGVNLGGWFVLEPWITPSIFAEWATNRNVKDEYTYTQALGQDEAKKRLSRHWNSWITQDDFAQIARAGLNHVRIPIGYWALISVPGDPYVHKGQLEVLDRAIGWARDAGLRVMLDLHGAPQSQNGFDNSGKVGPVGWTTGDTVSQTIEAIKRLVARYNSQSDVVTAIQLLNEPLGSSLNLDVIKGFYYQGNDVIRAKNQNTLVVLHDAFQDFLGSWNGFMSPGSGKNHVMLDTHLYQIFNAGDVSRNPTQHIEAACNDGRRLRNADKWTIVGEWTGAQTDCAKWLNGLGKGARYDGSLPGFSRTGSCDGKYAGPVANLSGDDKYNLRRFIEAQLDAYEQRTGWIFWTWKTESAPEWDLQDLLANGLFPQPLNDRRYPNQCGY